MKQVQGISERRNHSPQRAEEEKTVPRLNSKLNGLVQVNIFLKSFLAEGEGPVEKKNQVV